MTTSKLTLYNGALRLLGERRLASLTEDRPARRYLDDAWDDGVIDDCLEQGFWSFATRSVELQADTAWTSTFGYSYRFQHPDDYVHLKAICTDEYYSSTLADYSDEAGFWFADYDVLYIQYISNDSSYGGDYSLWPESFSTFVKAKLADEVKELITGNDGKYERIKKALKDAKLDARNKDVMGKPRKRQQNGTWVSARMNSVVNNSGQT